MSGNVYLLMFGADTMSPDIIYSRNSALKIAVYFVDSVPFIAHENEIQLYGYLGDGLLVFETVNISPDDALEVLSAIKWYTNYIGHPEIEILPDDPRMEHQIPVAL